MEHSNCAGCPLEPAERACVTEKGMGPAHCPTLNRELVDRVRKEYEGPELREFALQASIQEAEGYSGRAPNNDCPVPAKPRIQEIAEFSARMKYRKLGLVFCIGLRREAALVEEFLSGKGFQVVSVVCKAGRVPKEELGVLDGQKIRPGSSESMCNPVMQALVLNGAETEFNIVLGLCVGHDSIFFQYSKAPCTVLAAKDRPSGHNPMAAVYTLSSYHRYLNRNGPDIKDD